MEKLFGNDLTYNHSSAATDNKATYIEGMRSGRTKYRKMTPNSDVKTRTYGCLAIITGTAVYEVTSGGQDRGLPSAMRQLLKRLAFLLQFRAVPIEVTRPVDPRQFPVATGAIGEIAHA
jgi:hypothetical protein